MEASPKLIGSWLLIIVYMATVLYFVIRGAKKTNSIEDYAIGSMGFSPISVALALAASITSAATFIINPGFVALYGWSAVISYAFVLPLGALISLIIFTKGFRRFGTSIKALTMAQWIGNRYGSSNFALFFAFLSLLLITFIVLICVGITKVLAISLEVEQVYILAGVVIFIFGYMTFGGANSMVYTNTIQALIMLLVCIILLSSGYEHFKDGVQGFWDKLAAIDPMLTQNTNASSPLFRDFFEIIFCQFIIGIAVICQPHIITKSLLLKSEKDVNTYLLWGIVVEALFFLVVIVGLYARLEFPDLMFQGKPLAMDGIVSAYVASEFPVILTLIIILGLISAGISTLEGLIQSLSTTITSDILINRFGKQLFRGFDAEKKKIQANRLVIVVLAVISFGFSYQQLLHPNLSVAIFAQNGVYAYFSAAFVPVLFGTFFPKTPTIAPVAASISAILVHFSIYYGRIGSYMQEEVRNPAIASTFAILAALAVGSLFYVAFQKRNDPSEVAELNT